MQGKLAIAREAARLVRDGDAIAIDGSSSCYYVVKELLVRRGLVVVTSGLLAVRRSSSNQTRPSPRWAAPPGGHGALVGDMGATLAGRGRLACGFFGQQPVAEPGLLELSPEETAVKGRPGALHQRAWLFDSSKVGRFALHPFAESLLRPGPTTDAGTPDEEVMAWKAVGVPVQRVPVELAP